MTSNTVNPTAQSPYQFKDIGSEILSKVTQNLSNSVDQVKKVVKSSVDIALSTREKVTRVVDNIVTSKQEQARRRTLAARQQFEAMIAVRERQAQRYRRISRERFSQVTIQLLPTALAANYYVNPLER